MFLNLIFLLWVFLGLVRGDKVDKDIPCSSDDVEIEVRVFEGNKGKLPIKKVELKGCVVHDNHRCKPRHDVIHKLPGLGILTKEHCVWPDPLSADYNK